jgi:hypothetical protein
MKKGIATGLFFGLAYVVIKWAVILLLGAYLIENGWWSNWLILIFPVIALTVFSIRIKKGRVPPFRKFFVKGIEKKFPDDSEAIINEVDEQFKNLSKDTQFASTSGNPMDKRLDFSAYFLALIQVLEKRNLTYDEIKNTCLEITHAYVTPRSAFKKWMKRLPPKLVGLKLTRPILKIFNRKISTKGHPDGFRAEILTDKSKTFNLGYGVDILECGICKLFQKHQAGKYASILCEVDKVTTSLAGLEMIRSSTIALGADKCDFRYRRNK